MFRKSQCSGVLAACYVVIVTTGLHGEENVCPEKRVQEPSEETTQYLADVLRINQPGITDLGVSMAQAFTPIELLLEQEIVRARFGPSQTRTATVDLIFMFPEKSAYLTELRQRWIKREGNHYCVSPVQSIRAFAIVRQTKELPNGSIEVVTITVEATFHEQTDLNKDGVWDRKTCWDIDRETEKITRIKNKRGNPG